VSFRWDQLPETEPTKASKALEKAVAAAKKIASAKSVGYQTQLRIWIAEGIKREAKRA
jgi:hypothetical protein